MTAKDVGARLDVSPKIPNAKQGPGGKGLLRIDIACDVHLSPADVGRLLIVVHNAIIDNMDERGPPYYHDPIEMLEMGMGSQWYIIGGFWVALTAVVVQLGTAVADHAPKPNTVMDAAVTLVTTGGADSVTFTGPDGRRVTVGTEETTAYIDRGANPSDELSAAELYTTVVRYHAIRPSQPFAVLSGKFGDEEVKLEGFDGRRIDLVKNQRYVLTGRTHRTETGWRMRISSASLADD